MANPRGRPPKYPRPEAPPVTDFSALSPEDKADLQAEAQRAVEEEALEAQRKAFLAQSMEVERRKRKLVIDDPEDAIVPVLIDVAGYSDRIVVDGVIYMHGRIYEVPLRKKRVIDEIMGRTMKHEADVGGANRDSYRRPANVTLRPGMEGITTSNLMRV